MLALALFLAGGGRIVPGRGWRSVLGLLAALGATAAVFAIGLVVLLTDTTCVG
ncbi:MAG TPA: hypothetical protein VKB43_01525 [Gaiellaceae bacterium]|nr:hypothetical protein [Gaiellaceae bacterium]